MLRGRTAGWAICTALVISASVAHGQSAGEASVRLNGVPVIQVTASGSESATARAARIERRLERLADRVEESARPTVLRGPTDDTRVVQSGDAPIVTVTQADAEDHLLTVDALTSPEPAVRVRLLGTADMVLELRFWTDSRRADLLATTSVVRRRVVEAFSDAGLPLPEPDLRRVELQSDTSA